MGYGVMQELMVNSSSCTANFARRAETAGGSEDWSIIAAWRIPLWLAEG